MGQHTKTFSQPPPAQCAAVFHSMVSSPCAAQHHLQATLLRCRYATRLNPAVGPPLEAIWALQMQTNQMSKSLENKPRVIWFTWNKLTFITLAVMIANLAIGDWLASEKLVLVPPLLKWTIFIYSFGWIMVLAVGILMRPHGRRRGMILFLIAGAVLSCYFWFRVLPVADYTLGECISAPAPPNQRRFECFITYIEAGAGSKMVFTLEGAANSLVLRGGDMHWIPGNP